MAIELSYEGEIAIVLLNRPDALNALSFSLIRDIGQALDHVAASRARALVITGAGDKAFCAGADIKELVNRPLADQKAGAALGQAVFRKLDDLAIPSIAAINGHTYGGGAELALACSFRIATANARIGLPEIKLGLIPGYGGTQRLPRLIGEARALELILTGRTVRADEALQIGLVNRVVEGPLMEAAFAFAKEFTAFGKLAVQFAKEAVQRSGSTQLSDGLRAEADLSTLAYQTNDADEGMQAFIERRTPVFKGS